MNDALASNPLIALAMPAAGHATSDERNPPLDPIVGVGRIVHHDALPDGRSNIVIEGLEVREITNELPSESPYRRAETADREDEPAEPDVDERMSRVIDRLASASDAEREILRTLPPHDASHVLLAGLAIPAREKHEILSLRTLGGRIAALGRAADRLAGRRYPTDLDPGDPRLN